MAVPLQIGSKAVSFYDPEEEERKRRVAAAKAKGWDDATIQKFQLIDKVQAQQRRMAAQQQVAQQAQQPEKKTPNGLKRFLVNTGALIGSAGAGIAGAAAAPFTGGASLVGAFGAGAGIEAIRRRLLGEKQNIAASALEGGLALLPGVAKGIKAIKGAKGAVAASKSVAAEKEALKDAIIGGFKTPEGGGRLTKAGENIRASQRGIRPGEKLVNSIKEKPLNTAQSKEINQVVNQANRGVIPKSVRGQLVNVQAEKEKAGKALTSAAQSSKARVNKETTKIIEDTVAQERSKILKFDPTNSAHAKLNNEYATRLSKAKTPEQLLEQRRVFDKTAKATFTNPTTEQAVDKELAAVYRKAADKALAKIAGELKPLDKQYSLLSKAEQGLSNSKTRLNPSGVKLAGTSVNGQGVGGTAIQAAKEGAGKALQATGKVTANPIVKTGFQQGIARGLTKPYVDPTQLEQSEASQQLPADVNQIFTDPQNPDEATVNELVASGVTDPDEMFAALTNQGQAPSPEDLTSGESSRSSMYADLADQYIQAGDLKTAKTLLDFAKVTAEFEQSSTGSKSGGLKLSDGAIKTINDLKGGLSDIDSLSSLLQSNPGKTGNVAGLLGAKPLGFTIDADASNIQSQIDRVRQVIGKALEGGVLRKEDEEKYKKILPTMRDPTKVALYKLSELKRKLNEDLESYVTLQSSYGKGATDISNMFASPTTNLTGAYQ